MKVGALFTRRMTVNDVKVDTPLTSVGFHPSLNCARRCDALGFEPIDVKVNTGAEVFKNQKNEYLTKICHVDLVLKYIFKKYSLFLKNTDPEHWGLNPS